MTSHLSDAMTTTEVDQTCTTNAKEVTSSYSFDAEFYVALAVLFIGIVGTAGNALVLYALVASKQHKKHLLIVNQNALDFFCSFFLVVVFILKLCKFHLSSSLGYWLCVLLLSEYPVWMGVHGSTINLVIITIDRYLKVVHPIWSRKYLRSWVIHCAMVLSWVLSFVYHSQVFLTTELVDDQCIGYLAAVQWLRFILGSILIMCFYVIILVIFIFCYGRILAAIRHQASVMAVHSGPGSSSAQAQSNQIQSNVIKTMVLVSTLYAITWLPMNVYYSLTMFMSEVSFNGPVYNVTMFIAFFYTCANPFIYATKFDAVRKVIMPMIPCKKDTIQPASGLGVV